MLVLNLASVGQLCHWSRSSVILRLLLVNMKRMLFIQCNLLFILASYSPLTDLTGGKMSLLDNRLNSQFQVLTGEPPPIHLHHDAFTDSEVLAQLFWRFVKEGEGPHFYPNAIKYFRANLH